MDETRSLDIEEEGMEGQATQPSYPQGVETEFERAIRQLESINLVQDLEGNELQVYPSYYNNQEMKTGPEILKEIGELVVAEYDEDEASRAEWLANTAAFIKLFTSFMERKNTPWNDASNVCLPLLAIACLQFHARAYDALIPSKDVVKALPTGDEDIPRAERVSKYMNYQLLYEMPDFEEGMDKTLMQLPIAGDCFRKSTFDHDLEQVVSVFCPSEDVVVNYGVKTYDDCYRTTHKLFMRPWDINRRVSKGIYASWARDLPAGTIDKKTEIGEVIDKQQGISEPGTSNAPKPRLFLEQHRELDLDGSGMGQAYVVTVDYETARVARITRREYLDPTAQLKKVDYFTHYIFLPNPEGFYGLGFGILIRHLNEAANTIINEVIDAGTLANMQGGFVLKRGGLKTGVVHMERGVYKAVESSVDDIRKAIFNFDFKGPNQTLYAVLGLLYEYSKLVSSISETMTGQLPSSDTPASTVMALLEEGRKVFSSIHKRIHRSFKKELQKIARLNSIYMNEEKYFKVLGDNNMPTEERLMVGRSDFQDTGDIIPVSDPAIISRAEKAMKAERVLQQTFSSPLTANDPEAQFVATRRFYEALEVPNIAEILKPPPQPPDLPPEEENANFFTEKPATVLPNQDHMWHLNIHRAFLEQDTVFAQELTPQGKKLADMHVQETIAALYRKKMEQEKAMAQQGANAPMPMGPNQSGFMGGPR